MIGDLHGWLVDRHVCLTIWLGLLLSYVGGFARWLVGWMWFFVGSLNEWSYVGWVIVCLLVGSLLSVFEWLVRSLVR